MAAPLSGLKMVDIGWLMVGPLSARYLTELGASTIKVESSQRVDPLRGMGPFKDGVPGPWRTISYHMLNAGKRGLDVDVKHPQGLAIVRQLIAKADFFVESFTPGAIDKMGLGYDVLSAENPGLIMISTGILGRKGPMGKGTSGTGTTGSAFAGATRLMGWPDRTPDGPFGPWTDSVSPRFVVSSALAALHRRKTTGLGCHIDLAQAEAGLQFLSPDYLEYAVNDVVPQRRGSANSPWRAPCNAYRCKGEDSWLVIDAADDAPYRALAGIVGGVLNEPRFETLVGRLRDPAALDSAIGNWLKDRNGNEAERTLQAVGIPAHVVSNDVDLAEDPDLAASRFYRRIEDPVIGEAWIPAPQFTLEGTPHVERERGPITGDSTDEILENELGLTPEEIAALRRDGIVG